MTSEEIAVLVVLYVLALIIVILASKLWLAQRHIRHLKAINPITPIMFDHKKLVPKVVDATVPKSAPITIAAPILYKILAFILKRFYRRFDGLSINKEKNLSNLPQR